MTSLSTARHGARQGREPHHNHVIPIMLAIAIAVAAVALVGYLLRPTWESVQSGDAAQLPLSIAGTLFNVPTHAVRMKVQKHSGPQERVDLNFLYPSLEAPESPKHISAETLKSAGQPIDRIFVSIFAHHDMLSPDVRSRTIYPRYLEPSPSPAQDGLTTRAFRDGTPYSNEDLFTADAPNLVARCTRDGATPGMCLSERRIEGADLTFRFPRGWLAQWRDVAAAMDRLTVQLHGTR